MTTFSQSGTTPTSKPRGVGRDGDRSRVVGALLGGLASLENHLLVVGCSGFQSIGEDAQALADRPNVIFILTDDLDFASAQKMPGLNSLFIDEGVSFENAFTTQSLCCPSRATSLTGLYAHNHQIKGNKPPDGGFEKFRDQGLEEDTIAVRLQEEGYQTAYFGKYLNGYPGDEATHVPPGWNEWHGELEQYEPYDYEVNEYGEVVSYGSETEDYFTDVLSSQAMEHVRTVAADSRPFFIYLAPTAPHEPAIPAERHEGAFADEEAPRSPSFDEEDVSDKPFWLRDESERFSEEEISEIYEHYRDRLESMLAVDEMVASLIKELENAGELDNTYIFFTSDNGFLQGEHRIPQGKERPYEESAHIPLFVWGPGIAAGSEVEQLVLNTDFAPTFADLAKVEFAADGRSLAPLLLRSEDGEPSSSSWRSSVLLEKLPVEDNGDNAEETN